MGRAGMCFPSNWFPAFPCWTRSWYFRAATATTSAGKRVEPAPGLLGEDNCPWGLWGQQHMEEKRSRHLFPVQGTPVSSPKRWPKDNLFCITLLLSINALIRMTHSPFLVLLLCYLSWWWRMWWRRDFNALLCLTRNSLSALAYPKGPVQLSVLLPPLEHQTLLAFRARFPL